MENTNMEEWKEIPFEALLTNEESMIERMLKLMNISDDTANDIYQHFQ